MRRFFPLLLLLALAGPGWSATLVERDTSGVLATQAGEVEVVSKRTRSFKTFRTGPNSYRVGGQVGPLHWKADPWSLVENYKEIDLGIQLTPGQDHDAEMTQNGYQIRLWQNRVIGGRTVRYIAQFRRAGRWLGMAPLALIWRNTAGQVQVIGRPAAGITPSISNDDYSVTWTDCFGPGLSFRYNLRPDEFYKTVIVRAKADLPAPTIGLAGLRLVIVMALSWDSAATASNGFATGNQPADLSGDDTAATGTPDEELVDAEQFSHRDAQARDLWFIRQPRAWDSYVGTVDNPGPHEVAVQWRLRRKGGAVFGLFGVTASSLNSAQTVYPVFLDTDIGEEQTGASADDGNSYGAAWPGNSNCDGIAATNGSTGARPTIYTSIAARFQTVPIPQGATITAGSISLCSTGSSTGTGSKVLRIHAEAVDDGAEFNATTHKPASGSRTTANTVWDTGSGAWVNGTWYTSGDIAAVVKEITDRAGWAENNDLNLMVVNNAESPPASNHERYVYFWNQAGNVSGPKFNASYTTASLKMRRTLSHLGTRTGSRQVQGGF